MKLKVKLSDCDVCGKVLFSPSSDGQIEGEYKHIIIVNGNLLSDRISDMGEDADILELGLLEQKENGLLALVLTSHSDPKKCFLIAHMVFDPVAFKKTNEAKP
jgi:hypothetical protein